MHVVLSPESMSGAPVLHWDVAVTSGWAAVPAQDLLAHTTQAWSGYGMQPMSRAEAVSFAVYGRLLKYGQSMTMMLPHPGTDTLIRLLAYLHRLRFDALDGGIRSPWLQPTNVASRPDLIVWTRPVARHAQFARAKELHACILRAQGKLISSDKSRLRTVLLDGTSNDLLTAFAAVEKQTAPFVFVIDATPAGVGDAAGQLMGLLQEYFPLIPRLVLAALGDSPTVDSLTSGNMAGHLWRMRLSDVRQINGGKPQVPRIELGLVTDAVASTHLALVADKMRALASACEKEGNPVRQQLLLPMQKVFRALRALTVPLEVLEDALIQAVRPGPFPVLPLKSWLERARTAELRYGETGAAAKTADAALGAAYGVFTGATSGKAQGVLDHVRKALAAKSRIAVLVGSPMECATLEKWLEQECDFDEKKWVYVLPMDGVKATSRALPMFDHVILAGTLWPSRLHWLSVPCQNITILSYPFEVDSIRRQLGKWWEQCGRLSLPAGDKLHLWQLDWPAAGYCRDLETVPEANSPIVDASWAYPGSYKRTTKAVDIPMPDRHADWLDALMAEPDMDTAIAYGATPSEVGVVWIRLVGQTHLVCWSQHHQVLVLRGDDIELALPDDLAPGDEILLLPHGDERIATQAALFQLFRGESEGLEQTAKFAEKWQSMVDGVFKKLGTSAAIRTRLKAGGVQISEQAIGNWGRHKVLGPDNPKVIEIFAQLTGNPSPAKHAAKINNAIVSIRTEHRAIGRDLRRALLERAKGADQVKIGAVLLDSAMLDSLIEVRHVEEVLVPPLAARAENVGLLTMAAAVQGEYPDRLVFTAAAQRSMKECPFLDLAKFRLCIELIASRLWPMYNQGTERMHELLPAFEAEQITFASGTAATTQGKFKEYDRTYKGRTVDMGKHFCLGKAWNPRLTMRIHFHWEAADHQIVIHHAGEHLKTAMS